MAFGIHHVWIDSLCIIQDSSEDWEHECSRMCGAYSQSIFTIAATDSPNGTVGFLHPYEDPAKRQIALSCSGFSSSDNDSISNHSPSDIIIEQHRDLLHSDLFRDRPLLESRGWCFQERLLSTRYLSFRKDAMEWKCNSSRLTEEDYFPARIGSYYDSVQKKDLFTFTSLEDLYQYWSHMIRTYGDCEFTHQSDRLPALSGLAQYFSRTLSTLYKLDDVYLAGHWKGAFPGTLGWRQSQDQIEVVPSLANHLYGPSWSCVSRAYSVEWPFNVPTASIEPLAKLESYKIKPKRLDPFGTLSTGLLTLTSPLIGIIIGKEPYKSTYGQHPKKTGLSTTVYLDNVPEYNGEDRSEPERNAFAMALEQKRREYFNDRFFWYGLVLEEVSGANSGNRTFNRIGYLELYGDNQTIGEWLDDAEKATVDLI
jgi:hypothetical protein